MKELIVAIAGVWDGSEATWGFVTNEFREGEDMGCVSIARGEAPANAQHVGAELKAVMAAVLWGKQNGYSSFVFYHSYEGVEKWVTGEWKANKPLPIAYRQWMKMQHEKGLEFAFIQDKKRIHVSIAYKVANMPIKEVMSGK